MPFNRMIDKEIFSGESGIERIDRQTREPLWDDDEEEPDYEDDPEWEDLDEVEEE